MILSTLSFTTKKQYDCRTGHFLTRDNQMFIELISHSTETSVMTLHALDLTFITDQLDR